MDLQQKIDCLTQAIKPYPQPEDSHYYTKQAKKLYLLRKISEFIFLLLLQSMNVLFDHFAQQHSPLALGLAMNLIVIFWRGPQVWPSLTLATVLVWLLKGFSAPLAIMLALLNTCKPLAIQQMTHKFLGPIFPPKKIGHWLGFVFLATLFTALFSISESIVLTGSFSAGLRVGFDWAARSLSGCLLIFPASMVWASYPFIKQLLGKPIFYKLICLVFLTTLLFISSQLVDSLYLSASLFVIALFTLIVSTRLAPLHSAALTSLAAAFAYLLLAAMTPVLPGLLPNTLSITLYSLGLVIACYCYALQIEACSE